MKTNEAHIWPFRRFRKEGKQSSTEARNPDSLRFSEILRHIQSSLPSETFRDRLFQDISKANNKALEAGRYEEAVICNMIMSMVYREEGHVSNAMLTARIAKMILSRMLNEECDCDEI